MRQSFMGCRKNVENGDQANLAVGSRSLRAVVVLFLGQRRLQGGRLRKVDVCTECQRIPGARRQPPRAVVLHGMWDLDFSTCRRAVRRFTRSPSVLWRGLLNRDLCMSFEFLHNVRKSNDIFSDVRHVCEGSVVWTCSASYTHAGASVSMKLCQ